MKQLIARRIMFNSCATQDHSLYVPFSDLGRVLRARFYGASFRSTRSMRLEADWGMQRRMSHSCAPG